MATTIKEIRILPPFAISRLGSATTPVEAYDLEINDDQPLGFRNIVPKPTFTITSDGITATTPSKITFKEAASTSDTNGKIRPVAPFLEVFAITSDAPDQLVPLTTTLLQSAGFQLSDITWLIKLGNNKIQRRTGDNNDSIQATVTISGADYASKPVNGTCPNFVDNQKKPLPLGSVQFIKPNAEYPEIRLRYTPAGGKVYGASLNSKKAPDQDPTPDPNITTDAQLLYKPDGPWTKYFEGPDFDPTYTMPGQIFAGYSDDDGNQYSWGYLDDECDGIVQVNLGDLVAMAHICAGPPAFAPDVLPIRAISDELEQIILGIERNDDVPIAEVEEIVRRAFESITLMNTSVMNGNPINGRWNVASTMARQDTNDFGRLFEPIMASSIVDNLALRSLHERVFNGLSTGMAAWFADALRHPDKIGDLSNEERRKMPGLMRGADGRALTLTRRMINTVIKAAEAAIINDTLKAEQQPTSVPANDLVAQVNYRGDGNPYSVLPRAAISNCFPGLESDFRNIWRNFFVGLVLSENDNYVLDDKSGHGLKGHRLVAITVGTTNSFTMVMGEGPVFPGGASVPLITADNPQGAAFMEWSNLLALFNLKSGQSASLTFTAAPAKLPVLVTAEQIKDHPEDFVTYNFIVEQIFIGNSAQITQNLLSPGDLTQGLCAPWQNDYRECACYYWAATRPDYVNVEPCENGLSKGDMWLAKKRTGKYIPDNRLDTRLFSYNDLFQNWEGELNFIVNGRDALTSDDPEPDCK
ncbi:hypothetical protein ACDQ55_14950 [Chitinophaga sp. 30R24]|uniref:hypothetical protein n=1 Tax=Chitinophaga sp. 30R24 TaxID=3248838 RepID=UPI003B8F9BEC